MLRGASSAGAVIVLTLAGTALAKGAIAPRRARTRGSPDRR
jgi:hypothetical protein